jgi:hypothetical protein
MKRFCLAATLFAMSSFTPAFAADLGVSINIGEPGFYGQINIGNAPRPVLVYPQPMLIQPPPVGVVVGAPIYLHVPPGHAKHWSRYCARYHACGRPVYFVQDHWYNNVYVPHYQREHGKRIEHGDRRYREERNVHREERNMHREYRDERHDRGRRGD